MTKQIVIEINTTGVSQFTDEEFAEKLEANDIEEIDELTDRLEYSMRKTIMGLFNDQNIADLAVECSVEDVEPVDPYDGPFTDIGDGGGCSETTEHMNEVRND